jgi:hypothetical protein
MEGGDTMSTYEAIYLMLTFGLLIVALLAYIDKRKKAYPVPSRIGASVRT